MKALLTALFIGIVVSPLAADEPKTHPKTILVIRHAEKPDSGPELSDEGKQRAKALPDLFKKSASRPDPFPTPDVIFAAANSSESKRPFETVQPLAAKLDKEIHAKIKDKDFADLAAELTKPKYDGKTVLICWHHGKIPELLHSLGVDPKPKKIGDDVFDRVWVVTYDEKGKAQLADKPQALLPTDSKK